MTKEERKQKKAEAKKKGKGLWTEFKEFINKGNALMLAVGVVIGGAFSAIVTSVVGVLTSFISWLVPGDLTNLVLVLPPVAWNYEAQAGVEGVGQWFAADQFNDKLTETITEDVLNNNYKLIGNTYVANGAAYINFGLLINAVVSFILIAVLLFVVVKIVSVATAKKAELDAKLLEEHYKKHPEDRPAPVEPGVPQPTETELLTQIRDLLKEQKKAKK